MIYLGNNQITFNIFFSVLKLWKKASLKTLFVNGFSLFTWKIIFVSSNEVVMNLILMAFKFLNTLKINMHFFTVYRRAVFIAKTSFSLDWVTALKNALVKIKAFFWVVSLYRVSILTSFLDHLIHSCKLFFYSQQSSTYDSRWL